MFHTETITYGPVDVHLLYYEHFEMNEHLHNLLPKEHLRLPQYGHPLRRREFIATRVLRTMVFGNEPILYSPIGAPYIEEEGFISISHAHQVVGLAFCKSFPIGLDLEPIRPKVLRVTSKFLSPEEQSKLNTSDVLEMIKVWSGKEALYKLAGRKGIIFSKELLLEKRDNLLWNGKIEFSDLKKHVELTIDVKNDFVISINASPIYERKK
ncbi:MAG: 4'-phosphopantetheinyl transferase superfamily protein [Brumimicrobium sp.]